MAAGFTSRRVWRIYTCMKESRYIPEFENGRHWNDLLIHDPFPNLLYHRRSFRELPYVQRSRFVSYVDKARQIENAINAKARAEYDAGFVGRTQLGLSPNQPHFDSSSARALGMPELHSGALVDRSG